MAPTFGDGIANQGSSPSNHRVQIKAMIEKYARGLPQPPYQSRGFQRSSYTAETVLLTGSSGNVGSEILARLLTAGNVAKVSKGLSTEILKSNKLVFIEGDTTHQNLGLTEATYSELRDSVTIIIHNAWSINLAQELAFFEPMLLGLRNLIDMARSASSRISIRFLFISSVTSAFSWDYSQGPSVPEEVLHDAGVAIGTGYGESKFIAEQIVSRSGLEASSIRVCQITGRLSNGAWPTTEWVPKLVRSSLEMGAFPDIAGVISWVPVDIVAACVIDVALSIKSLPVILNLSHPRPVKWTNMIRAIGDATSYESGKGHLPYISLTEWVSKLEERIRTVKNEPSAKLLKQFKGLAIVDEGIIASGRQEIEHISSRIFSTSKMEDISPTLRGLEPIHIRDVHRWVEYWRAIGFIQPAVLRSRL